MSGHDFRERQLWEHPWDYRESFMVALEVLLLGLILEVMSRGEGIPGISFPWNVIIGIGLTGGIVFNYLQFRGTGFIRWLSGIPAAISAITLFTFLVLLQGFAPQNTPESPVIIRMLGIDHMKNSWVFFLAGIYLLTVLGSVIMKRMFPLKRRNLAFVLNHLGLWITIAAGSLGSGDLQRYSIYIEERGPFTSYAYDRQNQSLELPFAIRLIDFDIENYPPSLVLVDPRTNSFIETGDNTYQEAMPDKVIRYGNWQVVIEEYHEQTAFRNNQFHPSDTIGAAPAVKVSAYNKEKEELTQGWISCGSYLVPQSYLPLEDHVYLVMTTPEARKYSSDVQISLGADKTKEFLIEVNKPLRIKNWRLYQVSYDTSKGKWSELSIIEAVKDPWLHLVYTGIFMMIGGALYLFWTGRNVKGK